MCRYCRQFDPFSPQARWGDDGARQVLIGYALRFASKAGTTMGHEVDYSVLQEKARPLGRSLIDFGTLKPAEQILLDCCRVGETAKITANRPAEPSPENAVRAGFLRFLLLGGDNQTPIHEHGIQLSCAYIEGALDLKATSVQYNISITNCTFTQLLDFTDARFKHSVALDGCVISGLQAPRLIAGGRLSIQGVKSQRLVSLHDAQIRGSLLFSDTSLDVPDGDALCFDGAIIGGDVLLSDGFNAVGHVRLLGAQIGGQLNCSGAIFDGKNGGALNFDGSAIGDDVILANLKATSAVRLLSAQIGGQLNCNGASFDGKNGDALYFDRAVIKGNVFLNNGFNAVGQVCLLGAQIGGQLNCNGASFDGKNGDALSFDEAAIGGSVLLSDGFNAVGQVRLLGANIGGQFNCTGASFHGKHDDALAFDKAVIKNSVHLSDGFNAVGKVSLLGALIDGDLNCSDASFNGKSRDALSFERAVIKGNVLLRSNFKAMGKVTLVGAQIAGSLKCIDASFNGKGRFSLNASEVRIDGSLVLSNLELPLKKASFSRAKVAVLNDDEKAWDSDLDLNGFVYDFLDASAPVRATSRLDWLNKQKTSAAGKDGKIGADSKFCPQPWRQLQHVLREMGHTGEALEVGLAFERRLRLAGLIGQAPASWPKIGRLLYSLLARGLHSIYGLLTGFGYRPMLLLAWSLATWLTCSGVYWWAAVKEGVFAPSNPIVFQHADYLSCSPDRENTWRKLNPPLVRSVPKEFTGPGNWYLCEDLREEYTGFSPMAFSLDVLLPLVDLQQEKDWAPMIPTPKAGIEEFTAFGWKYFTRLVIWFQTLFGWMLSLLLVAIVSGLTRRKE
jgi:hypothetical protein